MSLRRLIFSPSYSTSSVLQLSVVKDSVVQVCDTTEAQIRIWGDVLSTTKS
jgi:hypothetical protein